MMIRDKKGIMRIDVKSFYTQKDIDGFNKKFGINGWTFVEPICSYLEPTCGYGQALTKAECPFCDGKCLRPQLES